MNPRLRSTLQILAGTLLVMGGGLAAKRTGLIDSDGFLRFTMALTGLAVAWYGNITPKQGRAQSARRLAYRRVVGYVIAVAGLVNAAIWAWAPMTYAAALSMAPLLAAFAVVLGYCLWLRGAAEPSPRA
ncbi:MAG: hypothetical protein K1X35_00370 [Caulobacteraceae bacterium]|nr:hypothetical protein [Caulobacteraceae bacterium]